MFFVMSGEISHVLLAIVTEMAGVGEIASEIIGYFAGKCEFGAVGAQ
ncbi:hypothetical protein [Paenibacillus cymbidii]|nr:hypothetical protein [Paenibacillus cymbidii]